MRFGGSDSSAYITTRIAVADSSAQDATTLSHGQRRRRSGTIVARGRAKLVNVRRITTSPPSSRFTSVASMPNGAISHRVVTPTVIMSAWASSDSATYSTACPSIARRRARLARTTREMPTM